MNESIFKEVEKREDEILEKLKQINDDIRQNMKITTGVSEEFKNGLVDAVTDLLYTLKFGSTWERDQLDD